MDTRVRYLVVLITYVAIVIVAGTAVTIRFTELDAVDSFYYVVQTMWTVGYGDVVPAGHVGKVITLWLNILGTVAVLSAIGIVSGIVLDRFMDRQRKLESEASERRREMRRAVLAWADRNGIDRSEIEGVIGDGPKEHRCGAAEVGPHRRRRSGRVHPHVLSRGGVGPLRLVLLRALHVHHLRLRGRRGFAGEQAAGIRLHHRGRHPGPVPGRQRGAVDHGLGGPQDCGKEVQGRGGGYEAPAEGPGCRHVGPGGRAGSHHGGREQGHGGDEGR